MTSERAIRSLAQLERSGSTARVLNLNAIARRDAAAVACEGRPLFHNLLLNRSIIIKHRLRRDEQDMFDDCRLLATKVMLPIDSDDLTVGAHYFFIGQKGCVDILGNLLGSHSKFGSQDRMALQILDECPTLDPFVLREQLRRRGLEPSPRYFEIGPGDLNRMHAFVLREVEPLATLTAKGESRGGGLGAGRLARKLLSSKADVETDPLRDTLKLNLDDYREGVFCWKGFLYYKWCLGELTPRLSEVAKEISQVKLSAVMGSDPRAMMAEDRARLRRALAAACDGVRRMIGVYDRAYQELVVNKDPAPFRRFLLKAPGMFAKLGEGLGAIQHIVSYWRYRFPLDCKAGVDPVEFAEILEDFSTLCGRSISMRMKSATAALPASCLSEPARQRGFRNLRTY